jgi:putative Holliday junction resolvase
LTVLVHESRKANAERIAGLAMEQGAGLIIIGQALDADGEIGPQARKSVRLAEAIQECCDLPVELWDESGSTQAARAARQAMGVKRSRRRGHLDDLAATYLLQSYLDHQWNLRQ